MRDFRSWTSFPDGSHLEEGEGAFPEHRIKEKLSQMVIARDLFPYAAENNRFWDVMRAQLAAIRLRVTGNLRFPRLSQICGRDFAWVSTTPRVSPDPYGKSSIMTCLEIC